MTFYERSELFRKYPKTPVFDHSNYRLFERIHAVPGTSNNRGLTVLEKQITENSNKWEKPLLSKSHEWNSTREFVGPYNSLIYINKILEVFIACMKLIADGAKLFA